MKINFLLFSFIILTSGVFAQTPQKQELKRTRFDPPTEINGFKVRYATLSKGKYQEIFSNDTIQQIGSVLFNRVTGEVLGEVIKDSLYFPADVVSRWWSIDPLAGKFPEQSPYVFVENNPVKLIDPNGMAPINCCPDIYPWMLNMQKSIAQGVSSANKRADATIRAMDKVSGGNTTMLDKASAYANAYLGTGAGNYTDANDVSVLAQGQNMDGTKATRGDYVFAGIGVMLPMVGGSAVKKMLEGVADIVVKNTTKQSGYLLDFTVKDGSIAFKGQKNPEGTYDFVITTDGELRIGSRHYTLSEGAESVKGAGQVYINKGGKIEVVDNFSGHYKPDRIELINQTKILQAAGLLEKGAVAVDKSN